MQLGNDYMRHVAPGMWSQSNTCVCMLLARSETMCRYWGAPVSLPLCPSRLSRTYLQHMRDLHPGGDLEPWYSLIGTLVDGADAPHDATPRPARAQARARAQQRATHTPQQSHHHPQEAAESRNDLVFLIGRNLGGLKSQPAVLAGVRNWAAKLHPSFPRVSAGGHNILGPRTRQMTRSVAEYLEFECISYVCWVPR